MTRKISAFGVLTGAGADAAADYLPIIDVSVADAAKNKKITVSELAIAMGTGSVALHGLTDVNVTEGAGINGYFLTWNNASSKWVAAAASSTLSGLSDVNVTEGSGINGNFLKWDNGTSKWIASASSSSLSGLSDVNVTEGAGIDGYSLKWNNATSKWIAATTSLSGLADVNVTEGSGINGYFLKWDNATSKWVASLSGAIATALSGLSDVTITSPAAGHALVYSGSAWVNKAAVDLPAYTISGATGAVSVDRNNGETQIIAMTGSITSITVTNWGASGRMSKLTLIFKNTGALTVAFPTAKWAGGVAPVVTSGTATDIFTLLTADGGTTVYGNIIGQNYT